MLKVRVIPVDCPVGDRANDFDERSLVAFGPAINRLGIDLVVDVRDVPDVCYALLTVYVPQQPIQLIEYDCGSSIAYMGAVVDGRPAHVHFDPISKRAELLFAARFRVP